MDECKPLPSGAQFWTVGGSGSVFYSDDQGKSWKRDRGTDEVAGRGLHSSAFQLNLSRF